MQPTLIVPFTPLITPSYTHKMAHVSRPEILWRHFALCIPVGKKIPRLFFAARLLRAEICALLRCSTVVTDVTFWRMAVDWNIFVRFSNSFVNGVFGIFIFQRLMASFPWNCFSVARLPTVCIYTLLFCCACSRMAWQWELPSGNPTGMGIRLKPGSRERQCAENYKKTTQ